jgi:hypothetical protein
LTLSKVYAPTRKEMTMETATAIPYPTKRVWMKQTISEVTPRSSSNTQSRTTYLCQAPTLVLGKEDRIRPFDSMNLPRGFLRRRQRIHSDWDPRDSRMLPPWQGRGSPSQEEREEESCSTQLSLLEGDASLSCQKQLFRRDDNDEHLWNDFFGMDDVWWVVVTSVSRREEEGSGWAYHRKTGEWYSTVHSTCTVQYCTRDTRNFFLYVLTIN